MLNFLCSTCCISLPSLFCAKLDSKRYTYITRVFIEIPKSFQTSSKHISKLVTPSRTPRTSMSKPATSHESSGSDTEKSQVHVDTRQRRARNKMATPVKSSTSPPPHPRLNIKIPPFWPEKPAIWFAQVEGQFEIMQVTDDRVKFYHILATLDRQYAAEVEDILTGPPDFQRLKDELIKRLSASRENKVKQLLTHEQLGTRKPSQFLRHLRHLAGPDIPEEFVRTIWASRLPTSMQPIVASQSTLPLDALAELADRVNDIAAPAYQVAATASSSSSASASPMDELTRQVAELTRQVSALTAQSQHRSRPTERRGGGQRSRSASRRSQSSYKKFPVCWYHSRHGTEARRCVKPCDHKAGNATGSR